MPSARSFYTQKTITTTTTRTKTVPQRQQTWQVSPQPIPEPRSKTIAVRQFERKDDFKIDQSKNVVFDTLTALADDCNATAQLLRSRSSSRTNLEEDGRDNRLIYQFKETDIKPSVRTYEESYRSSSALKSGSPLEPEVEYKLRLKSPIYQSEIPAALSKKEPILQEKTPSLEKLCKDFDIETPRTRSVSRPRSETPTSRRLIVLEEPKDEAAPICAYCHQSIYGPCITALAPNSKRAQKYHPHHFMCNYCLKPLNLKGSYREQDEKPYCVECFYRLFSGHIYNTENQISLAI